jgi:DNA-damage-inducible protein J
MSQTSMLHVRVDTQLKKDATETLAKLGLTLSDAIRLFLNSVVREQGLPISLKLTNEEINSVADDTQEKNINS